MWIVPRALLVIILALGACGRADRHGSVPLVHDGDPVPAYVADAIADPGRAAQRVADARRHPAELVAFSGLAPGNRVLDLIPGDGYWTRIFSRVVGPQGRVYAVWPQAYARLAQGNVRELRSLAASPDYSNVRVAIEPTNVLSSPEPLDMVWTSQNYHDYPDAFMGHTDPNILNRAVFALLRPGGTWFIIDHAAEPGVGMRDTERLHRIDEATVRRQVAAAGFEFVGESRVLRNPADDHRLPVFDRSIRGHTDQFVLRFRKPS
jgi:predicted methyltransferase